MTVSYSATMIWRDEPELRELVDRAALAKRTKPSEWLRQAVRTTLQREGFDPATAQPRDAGALYDRIDGKQRWALVIDGQISGTRYDDAKPEEEGEIWLPVVHFDSEPFDAAIHWRLAPVYTIEADRVVSTYPIVAKTKELA